VLHRTGVNCQAGLAAAFQVLAWCVLRGSLKGADGGCCETMSVLTAEGRQEEAEVPVCSWDTGAAVVVVESLSSSFSPNISFVFCAWYLLLCEGDLDTLLRPEGISIIEITHALEHRHGSHVLVPMPCTGAKLCSSVLSRDAWW